MIVWSLFDGSGIMGLPWALAGHEVYCFNSDKGNHGEYEVKMCHEKIKYVDSWISEGWCPEGCGIPDIIFSFPDCTMLAGSGEKHERPEGEVEVAVANARVAEALGIKFNTPWLVENPVGKLSTEWRKADHYIDPYQFGGYLSGYEQQFHPRMPRFDAYTKKTAIWCGNGMEMPEKRPVPHIGMFWGWAYLGGKSAKTKQLRSLTPRGFAKAIYEANK